MEMPGEELRKIVKGDVLEDPRTIREFSRDASMFVVRPRLVVFPRDTEDVKALVKYVAAHKRASPELSLTARAAGTDMSGGALNDSIIVAFGRYFTRIKEIRHASLTAEPGVFYRDFERETLRHGLLLPSYPASRELCALGGMVNNNSGGEKTLEYGKTEEYVTSLRVVLRDGNEYLIRPISEKELAAKTKQKNFEGEIYRKMHALVAKNYDLLRSAKPKVSKNSAGYALWNVWEKGEKVFDLTKVFVGAQGTLGLVTEITFRLVPVKKHSQMVVVFLKDLRPLVAVIHAVLPLKPESFESYDDHTLRLALKYFPSFAKNLGAKNILSLAWQFLPEIWMTIRGGMPKLVLQVEFTGSDSGALMERAEVLKERLAAFPVAVRVLKSQEEAKKYWVIRRESFNLLRHRIKNKHTAPFIDDIIVAPDKLEEFLPRLNKILEAYPALTHTIAGHMGNGNFHIIPLMDLKDEKQRNIIHELSDKVYDLVIQFGGSITGEHNDGLIRSPYLKKMYGEKVYKLFEETKHIFDPQNIFNPRKKVGSDLSFSLDHIRRD